jgi:hypothetical protein
MQANIQTDVVSYRAQVEKLSRLTGRGLKSTMQESVSVMAGQLVKRFPPNSKGVGQRAIRLDLYKIINTSMSSAQLQNALDITGDDRYDPDGIKIEEWHEQKRKDNVKGRMRPAAVVGKDRLPNGWKASRKLHAPESAVKRYAKRRGEQVGQLKSHWAKATQMYRGAAKIPSWVSRHGAKGHVRDAMKDNGDGFIEITNTVKQASQWQDINNFVVRSQSRMIQKKIKGELKKQADRFNRSRAA